MFADDEGAQLCKSFQTGFREEMRTNSLFLLTVSLRTCQQSSDISLAGIEQLQEIVAEFDSADRFDDEWFIQQLHVEIFFSSDV